MQPRATLRYAISDHTTRRLRTFLLTAGIVFFAAWSVQEGRYLLRAVTLIYGLSRGPSPGFVRLYMRLGQRGVLQQDISVESAGLTIPVRLYTPTRITHAPVIVIVHGLAEDGNRSIYLNKVAQRLADCGYQVVIPDLPASKQLLMRSADLNVIGTVINWSAVRYGQRVSLFGVSFGGGMAIAAAEIPAYADNIKMVFSLSGYNSIDRLGSYYLHDPVFFPDGTPYPRNAYWLHAWLIALQHLDEMVPANDVVPLRSVIFNAESSAAAGRRFTVPEILAPLNTEQRQILLNLCEVQSAPTHALYVKLIQTHQAELAAISPQTNLASLKPQLFVAHGTDDTDIPLGESEWTQKEASPASNAQFLFTSRLSHAKLNGAATRWQMLRLVPFVARALKFASNHP
jgi:pimeloyl-ACP methyl ester carboxylesterase